MSLVQKKLRLLREAAWFKDKFGMLAQNAQTQQRYTATEALFNLDESGLCKTIHIRHEGQCNNDNTNAPVGTPPRTVHRKTTSVVGMVDLTGNTRVSVSQMSSSFSDEMSLSDKG